MIKEIFARWYIHKGDLVTVCKQLRQECPISTSLGDFAWEGIDVENGTLTFKFEHALLVEFRAPLNGKIPKDFWISPLILCDKSSHQWGILKDGKQIQY